MKNEDPIDTIAQARTSFEDGKRLEERADFAGAARAYTEAAGTARALWKTAGLPADTRSVAARLDADAAFAAGTSALQSAEGAIAPLRDATLSALAIFEDEALEPDLRLHGLYRAQCAAFELGHVFSQSEPVEAVALFRDAAGCVEALGTLTLTDPASDEKAARVRANGAAASVGLGRLLREMRDSAFKDHLVEATTLGRAAVESGALPGALEAETMLVVSDAAYELGLSTEEREEAVKIFEDALGWARMAAEAPGADGALQAEALLRGANIACVYGLSVRHDDFNQGLSALDGAFDLARAAASAGDHLPVEFQATAIDMAVRIQQNIGLLTKAREDEGSLARAITAFEQAIVVAENAAAIPVMSQARRASFLYLAANATLERAILGQVRAGSERDAEAMELFTRVQDRVRDALRAAGAPDIQARAALLACGASGRLLRIHDPNDHRAVQTELEYIEAFGQRAAQTEGADLENRKKGAYFAADAARRLASILTHPAAKAEAESRAGVLEALHRRLGG